MPSWWEGEARAAWGQPGLGRAGAAGEDEEARRAAYWLAAASGHARTEGGEPAVLPPAAAMAAGRRLLGELAALAEAAGGLERAAASGDGGELHEAGCGLVEWRDQARAAYVAIDDALQAALWLRLPEAAGLAAMADALADATALADGRLLARLPLLRRAVAGLPLLANMRAALRGAFRLALPWWLDGRLG